MGSGGAREGAGRKPTEDRLVPFYMSVRQSTVDLMDDTTIRKVAERAVQLKANRIRKRNGQKG
jgi:hypothetical protein